MAKGRYSVSVYPLFYLHMQRTFVYMFTHLDIRCTNKGTTIENMYNKIIAGKFIFIYVMIYR